MNDKTLYPLIGLLILSFCSSLIGLFFAKNVSFKEAIRIMIGSFFLGSTIAYLIYDTNYSGLFKKSLVTIISMFAKPLYDKIYSKIGIWLDKWVSTKINGGEKVNNNTTNTNDNNDNTTD